MKTKQNKVYITLPIALMATIIAAAENKVKSKYQTAAEKIARYYNRLSIGSSVIICNKLDAELITPKRWKRLFRFVQNKLGNIRSYKMEQFNNQTTIYKLDCAKGSFKMILVKGNDELISAIDFSKEETFALNTAA